jgi:SAM-dependent MidA family methyltransferase
MELALYDPEFGYYNRQQQIGRRGDFFTGVSAGNLFGRLLAFQFAEWFEKREMRNAERGMEHLQIIEPGAHDGQLALDILNWFKNNRPSILQQLNYCILEPSPRRRDWQKKTLTEFSEKILWFDDWSQFTRSAFPAPRFTVVFSNELFDAMPAHRLSWDAKTKSWFEWGVAWDGNHFVWKRLLENQISVTEFPKLAPELLEVLPDGFTTEVCPAAVRWWIEAASISGSGKLLAIDYGLLAEEFFTPARSGGTLRAFFRHHAESDLLARPGELDITAHVNFSALKEAGETAGLKTDTLVTQPKFLTEIAARSWKKIGEWDAGRRKQFQTLTHPEHLGRAFRVLIQSR